MSPKQFRTIWVERKPICNETFRIYGQTQAWTLWQFVGTQWYLCTEPAGIAYNTLAPTLVNTDQTFEVRTEVEIISHQPKAIPGQKYRLTSGNYVIGTLSGRVWFPAFQWDEPFDPARMEAVNE